MRARAVPSLTLPRSFGGAPVLLLSRCLYERLKAGRVGLYVLPPGQSLLEVRGHLGAYLLQGELALACDLAQPGLVSTASVLSDQQAELFFLVCERAHIAQSEEGVRAPALRRVEDRRVIRLGRVCLRGHGNDLHAMSSQ
jgi:hypothetical protein